MFDRSSAKLFAQAFSYDSRTVHANDETQYEPRAALTAAKTDRCPSCCQLVATTFLVSRSRRLG